MSETTETGRMRPTIALIEDDPYLKLSADERLEIMKLRRARLRGYIPDQPIACLSATQRSGVFRRPPIAVDRTLNPTELDSVAFAAWLKRQEQIHPLAAPMKEPWFAIDAEIDPLQPRVDDIQKIVARAYGISRRELMSHRRLARVVLPRQIAMFLAKTMTKKSLPDVGRRFSYRDHTTVLYAVRKLAAMIEGDRKLAGTVEELKGEIMAVTIRRHADAEDLSMEEEAIT